MNNDAKSGKSDHEDFSDRILGYISERSAYGEVRFMRTSSKSVLYRNGEFDGSSVSDDYGYAVRIVNNSISMAFTNSGDWEKIKDSIDAAIASSRKPGKNKIYSGRAMKDSWKATGRDSPKDKGIDEMASIVKENDKAVENEAQVRINSLSDKYINGSYYNTDGSEIHSEFSRIYYVYMIGVSEGGNYDQSSEEFGYTGGYEAIEKAGIPEKMRDDANSLRESLEAPGVNPGVFDVVAGPKISGIVAHESAGHPMEYDRIIGREGALAGESFLTGKAFPFRIGSDDVSVIDDPTVPGSFGYYRYDDEGIPARKRYLYRKGYTDEFLLNRESAAIIGTEPNGSGRSSDWDMEPLARMSTTYIEPGNYTFEELFEGIHRGVYIKSFTEWNIDDIRFNEKYVGRDAYLIENGNITGRVRKPVIETNTVKFYSSIDAVGKDLNFSAGICGKGDPEQGVDVWMGGPHIRLRNVHLK